MKRRAMNTIVIAAVVSHFLVWPRIGIGGDTGESNAAEKTKILSGEPRLLIVHGYSTSAHWWASPAQD